MYVLNGATKCDVLTGSELSIQRNGSAVHIDFPNADGAFVVRFAKKVSGEQVAGLTWVSYAQADWVARSKVEEDIPAKLS
jgi:hypothetical protein